MVDVSQVGPRHVGRSIKQFDLKTVLPTKEVPALQRNNIFTGHYEMGIRLYISPTLNLKAGWPNNGIEWRIGEYSTIPACKLDLDLPSKVLNIKQPTQRQMLQNNHHLEEP